MKWLLYATILVTSFLIAGLVFLMITTSPDDAGGGVKVLLFFVLFLAGWGLFTLAELLTRRLAGAKSLSAVTLTHGFRDGAIVSAVLTLFLILRILFIGN